MTARLPTPGGDSGTWGDVLNTFLAVGHDASGKNLGVRTVLTQNTTFYVATTGNDSTGDGSVGSPWKTTQFAYNWLVSNIDAAGFDVTLQHADGTYDGLTILANVPNTNNMIFQGNVADYTKVIFTSVATGWNCVEYTPAAAARPLFVYITFAPSDTGHQALEIDAVGSDIHFASVGFVAPAGGGGDCIVHYDDYTPVTVCYDPRSIVPNVASLLSG